MSLKGSNSSYITQMIIMAMFDSIWPIIFREDLCNSLQMTTDDEQQVMRITSDENNK